MLRKLNPFLDKDGIIRVGGQILKADLSEVLRTPVILPKSSNVASLVIRHTHGRTHHSGRGITLNKICAIGYWIISRSTMVRWFISKWKNQKKWVTYPYLQGTMGEQKMADLPKLHVEPAPPFTYCGIDFFGSWHVQYGRSVVKRNGALFTCMASRAVHIEVADSLQPILSSTEKIHLSKRTCPRNPLQQRNKFH